jgi:hypothetical protein
MPVPPKTRARSCDEKCAAATRTSRQPIPAQFRDCVRNLGMRNLGTGQISKDAQFRERNLGTGQISKDRTIGLSD